MNDDHDDELPMVVCCQGPPACLLEGDEAELAAKAGCVWCNRMTLLPSGEWHITEPTSS